jgi:hypothetical protein
VQAVSWVHDASDPQFVTAKDMLPLQDVLDRNFHLLLWKANLSVMKSPGFTKGHVHLPPVLNILCSGGTKIFFMFAPHPKLSSRQQLSLKAMMVHARTHNVQIQWSIVDATHGLFFPPMWWHAVCNTGCRQVMNDTLITISHSVSAGVFTLYYHFHLCVPPCITQEHRTGPDVFILHESNSSSSKAVD